jgi:hypothetical protein
MVIQAAIERRFVWTSQRGGGRSMGGLIRQMAPLR